METYYRVEVTYPDGHTEEIGTQYKSAREAVDFGANLLVQVSYTEQYHRDNDVFGMKEKIKPYFLVTRVSEQEHKLVFDSRTVK